MSELNDAWGPLISTAAYDAAIEYYLKPNPLLAAWKREHDEWWARQTRWFKARHKTRLFVSGKWYSARRAVADRIFPEGRDYE